LAVKSDYPALGLNVGLEIHQQLDTAKMKGILKKRAETTPRVRLKSGGILLNWSKKRKMAGGKHPAIPPPADAVTLCVWISGRELPSGRELAEELGPLPGAPLLEREAEDRALLIGRHPG